MRVFTWSLVASAALLAAPTALGVGASVDEIGGDVTIRATRIGDVFTSGSPVFTESDLIAIRSDVESDLGMGATNGLVTFLLLQTANDGLSFVTLVDSPLGIEPVAGIEEQGSGSERGSSEPTSLQMATDAPTTATPFINDQMFDLTDDSTTGGRRVIGGEWTWDAAFEGDGFAWATLEAGDVLSYAFTEAKNTFPGLDAVDTFRFLSFEEDGWTEVARRSFTQQDQFGFTLVVNVIPTPLGGLMGLAGLGWVASRRRR